MEKLKSHSDPRDRGEKSRTNLMGSNGNRRGGSKRTVGRPRNKMKKIDEIVTCSGPIVGDVSQEDRRSVLDLDEIVREHLKKISELRDKNGEEICIISSDDDDDDRNHEYEHKVKEMIVRCDDGDYDDDQSIGHEKGQQEDAQSLSKRRKKSALVKDDV